MQFNEPGQSRHRIDDVVESAEPHFRATAAAPSGAPAPSLKRAACLSRQGGAAPLDSLQMGHARQHRASQPEQRHRRPESRGSGSRALLADLASAARAETRVLHSSGLARTRPMSAAGGGRRRRAHSHNECPLACLDSAAHTESKSKMCRRNAKFGVKQFDAGRGSETRRVHREPHMRRRSPGRRCHTFDGRVGPPSPLSRPATVCADQQCRGNGIRLGSGLTIHLPTCVGGDL